MTLKKNNFLLRDIRLALSASINLIVLALFWDYSLGGVEPKTLNANYSFDHF